MVGLSRWKHRRLFVGPMMLEVLDQILDQLGFDKYQGPSEIQSFNVETGQLSAVWFLREGLTCPRVSGKVRYYPAKNDAIRIIKEVDPTYGELVDYLWVRDLWCFKIVDRHTYSYDPERNKIIDVWLDGKEIKSLEKTSLDFDTTTEVGRAYKKLVDALDVIYPPSGMELLKKKVGLFIK